MNRLTLVFLTPFLFCLFAFPVISVQAGVGGPYGEYQMAYQGPEALTLLVVPDGSGGALNEASLPLGGTEDATITLFVFDTGYDPIALFPAEDMWLESEDNGLILCNEGSIADADTDIDGRTQWVDPLFGGGHSQALTVVKINGMTPELTSGVNLSFNSPDINGDLIVNLSDVPLFVRDYYSDNDFRSDFHRDGIVNLSDLVPLVRAIGANCP